MDFYQFIIGLLFVILGILLIPKKKANSDNGKYAHIFGMYIGSLGFVFIGSVILIKEILKAF
jgi:hypothetical protein